MTIIDLCKAYDEAEKVVRTQLCTSEMCRAERVARERLCASVREAMADGRRIHELAYFSAWSIMRGGFTP